MIRFGLAPLTTRFVDVWDGVEAVRSLLSGGEPYSRLTSTW